MSYHNDLDPGCGDNVLPAIAFALVVALLASLAGCSAAARRIGPPPMPDIHGTLALTRYFCDEGPLPFYRKDVFYAPQFEEIEAHEKKHVADMQAAPSCEAWNAVFNGNAEFREMEEARAWCAVALFDMDRYGMVEQDALNRAADWYGGYETVNHAHALAAIKMVYQNGSCS